MDKLQRNIRDSASENMRYRLGEIDLSDRLTCVSELPDETEIDDLVYETVHSEIDNALIYTWRIRELWEQLGEPDPDDITQCTDIDHAILIAVSEALMDGLGGYDLYGEARQGVFDALVEWVSDNNLQDGEYSGDDPVEYMEAIQSCY